MLQLSVEEAVARARADLRIGAVDYRFRMARTEVTAG